MTTKAAEDLYLSQHLYSVKGKGCAVYNPNNIELNQLPIIYGFNNGGSRTFLSGLLISADGEMLGGHACSNEAYMPHDLGILEGSRSDRHEEFKKHYPNGYRMQFVSYDDVKDNAGLQEALKANKQKENENE